MQVSPDQLHAVAVRAGAAILAVYHRPGAVAVEYKSDASPLTEADRAAHVTIVDSLARLTPDIPVVSEEDGFEGDLAAIVAGDYWLVDPLDGTKEFLKRTGEFTVNIALVRDGVPVAAVVHAPALGASWVTSDAGAERWDHLGRSPIHVCSPARLDDLRIVASRDHAGPHVAALLAQLPGARTVSMGSSLKFCMLAEGRADLYFRDGPTMPWDIAAAHGVLRAAGGEVFDLEGAPLRYLVPRQLNPHFVALGDRAFRWAPLFSAAGIA
jgi:3'(2'), 5'-bisphosphate nucleotidase